MKTIFQPFKEFIFERGILGLFFPKFCLGCTEEGTWVCKNCQEKIIQVKTQVCPDCGRVSTLGRYCAKHRRLWGLSGIIVASYYQEGPLKEIIHNFKYNHILELGNLLKNLMVHALKENLPAKKNLLLCAVPLHFLKRSQRGYNQAEILADLVAKRLMLPLNCSILKKVRWTKSQVQMAGKKRLNNLAGCFKIHHKMSLKGKTVILIDDVTTTGTTLNECAKLLRKNGVNRVWGLVAARG